MDGKDLITFCFIFNLFLRDDEVAAFGVGDCQFLPELTTVDNDGVPTMLDVRVMGKSDKKPVVLCMYLQGRRRFRTVLISSSASMCSSGRYKKR